MSIYSAYLSRRGVACESSSPAPGGMQAGTGRGRARAAIGHGPTVSLHAVKGNCCMCLVNKVEIHLEKMGFMDCKWTNLNTPGSYTSLYH